jgi:predicted nucleic-acid-binding protein
MPGVAGSLDANLLLRLLLNDVADQHAAAVKLIQGTPGQFAVSDIAILELVFVLGRHYGFTRAAATEAVDGLMGLTQINCNRALFEKALPLFIQHPKLSFEDCCMATYAALNNAEPLWTFDQKLAHQVANAKLVAN